MHYFYQPSLDEISKIYTTQINLLDLSFIWKCFISHCELFYFRKVIWGNSVNICTDWICQTLRDNVIFCHSNQFFGPGYELLYSNSVEFFWLIPNHWTTSWLTLSSIYSWLLWKHLHHSHSNERDTGCSVNTCDCQQWIWVSFEPVIKNVIAACCQ